MSLVQHAVEDIVHAAGDLAATGNPLSALSALYNTVKTARGQRSIHNPEEQKKLLDDLASYEAPTPLPGPEPKKRTKRSKTGMSYANDYAHTEAEYVHKNDRLKQRHDWTHAQEFPGDRSKGVEKFTAHYFVGGGEIAVVLLTPSNISSLHTHTPSSALVPLTTSPLLKLRGLTKASTNQYIGPVSGHFVVPRRGAKKHLVKTCRDRIKECKAEVRELQREVNSLRGRKTTKKRRKKAPKKKPARKRKKTI